jgi:hypothetical protein
MKIIHVRNLNSIRQSCKTMQYLSIEKINEGLQFEERLSYSISVYEFMKIKISKVFGLFDRAVCKFGMA